MLALSLLNLYLESITTEKGRSKPKEHHQKSRLTKNENMTIALIKNMARSSTDISDELLEQWLELRCCFSV